MEIAFYTRFKIRWSKDKIHKRLDLTCNRPVIYLSVKRLSGAHDLLVKRVSGGV